MASPGAGEGVDWATRVLLCVLAAGILTLVPVARSLAEGVGGLADLAALHRLYRGVDQLPGIGEPAVRNLWAEAIALEAKEDLLTSARRYEEIVRRLPDDSHAYWRVARNYWRVGEALPPDRSAERIRYFELTEDWAAKGLRVNPRCGECCLYKFTGMARQATTRGLFTAARRARQMSRLLQRGIALQPAHADNDWNTTLGNLYYAASHFYRIVPDWFWLRWIIGTRGDKKLALEYARRAHAISSMRIDYTVTLGAALLCEGTEQKSRALLDEGIELLKQVPSLPILRPRDDPLYQEQARTLMSKPQEACSYSPDGWIDIDGTMAKVARVNGQ